MKKLQDLLTEANRYIEHVDAQIAVPLIREGVLYELSDTIIGMTQSVGRIEKLGDDYQNEQEGIGKIIPQIPGLPKVLAETQVAASKIITIQLKHRQTLHEMSQLCFNHIIHAFPHGTYISHGGIFRIQITATSAVFQILFLVGHGLYAVSHEADLSTVIDGSAFRKQPFSQVPPDLAIASSNGSGDFVSATYGNWVSMIQSMHHNTPRPKVPMYRSRTADVFAKFGAMVEELMAA